VRAQAPLVLPTPTPPAAHVVATTQAPPHISVHRPAVVLQVAPVPKPAPVPMPALAGPVRIEVTVDATGIVADARVIDGPIDQRRSALLAALDMRFPASAAPTTREITVLANAIFGPDLGVPPGITPVVTRGDAQERLAAAMERIAKLKAQQAGASERGAAQLQEAIDAANANLENIKRGLSVRGKTLSEIRINGLEAARQQLPDLLPIQVHGILSEASMDEAIRTVKQLYPNAAAYFGVTANGDVVFIVTVPARGGVFVR
jgi:hypothetical protein